MKIYKNISLIFFLIILAGCSSIVMRQDTAKPPELDRAVKYDTQVSIGQCVYASGPEAGFLGAIAGALLSSTISEGVNYLGNALESAAEDKQIGVLATRNIEVSGDDFGPCIQLVRGWFYTDATPQNPPSKEDRDLWIRDSDISEDNWNNLSQNNIWLAASPDFFFEG